MTEDLSIVERYYAAFNSGDVEAMLDCVTDDVVHNVNEGRTRVGRDRFAQFCAHMARCYREELRDLVVLSGADGRYAVEFTVHGTYVETDGDLPEARGQTYVLPAGTFLTAHDGQIGRITTYYNLSEWLRQIG